MRLCGILALFAAALFAQQPKLEFLNRNQSVLDAHNCYPYDGRWADRIDRALATGFPVGVELDLAWHKGRAVITHDPKKITGAEPTPRDYFFERIRSIVEKELREGNRSQWPLIILHFDFKMNDAPLLRAVWDLLGEYDGWITTARKGTDPRTLEAFDTKPILVLTEDSDAQEEIFFKKVPAGAKLRLFGSAHTSKIAGDSDRERGRMAATMTPEALLTERPTNYRRWWNSSWYAVEEGGQPNAGAWTAADKERLQSLVRHAHELGFWIRFYTLNGHDPAEARGWGNGYNFGSRDAVMSRWKAAIEAGVDLIATDQYEDLAGVMKQLR